MKIKPKANLRLFFLACVFIFLVSDGSACSVFNKAENGKVLFGNVENEASHFTVELQFIPANETLGLHGGFLIFYNGNVAGGMNDQGLCFDVAALPQHPAFNGKPHGDLMNYLLTRCATLSDALDFFYEYFWPGHSTNHIMIMDSTGASAIVEMIGANLYVYSGSEGKVMTNYCIADPEIRLGAYPCPRFEKVTDIMDTAAVTLDNFQKTCEAVHHAYHYALYANIYDPVNLDIYFFNANLPGSPRTHFHLPDELEKGPHHYLLKNNEIFLSSESPAVSEFFDAHAFPNPFGESVKVAIQIGRHSDVDISVFNLNGAEVGDLENKSLPPGRYDYIWWPADLPSGIYICRIQVNRAVRFSKWVKH